MLEFLKLCLAFSSRRATESGLITSGPALIFSVYMVAKATGDATAALYDTHGAFGKPLVDLAAVQSSTDPRVFVPPIYFDQGVWVEFGDNVASVLVQFRRTRELVRRHEKPSLRSYLPSWLGGYGENEENY